LIYKNFQRHAKTSKIFLTEDEWVACVNGKAFSKAIAKKIDAIFMPSEEDYLKAAEDTGSKYYTEKDMLMTFMQTSEKTTKKNMIKKSKLKSMLKNAYTNKSGCKISKKDDEEAFDEEKQRYIYRIFEFKGKE
jgi:siroheme synthase (precorrin-2 oxidase/ferrochelatase)